MGILFGKKGKMKENEKKPINVHFLYGLQSFRGGQHGNPIRMYIFRKNEWPGPEPVGELVLAIAQSLQSQFGITVLEADYHTCQPMDVIDNPKKLDSFFGGPAHVAHFMLMRFAGELLEGAMDKGTHDVWWIAFEDSKGSRGMVYIFAKL